MEGVPPIDPYVVRYQELDAEMAKPDFFQDQRRAAALSREHQKLSALIEKHGELNKVYNELLDTREILNDESADEELKELAEQELPQLEESFETKKHQILISMIPPDPTDSRNTIVEIRAGAGGDEASLFVGDLMRMYQRYAEASSWKVEPMSSSPSEVGGYKEIIFLVSGEEVYKKLRYES
ncbi:MAG: PCRF domain-containing protein, partial [Verrucomicrobiae bacterium]|nr:PCRF domain-containing protein [Verrucomicrobiae bacterium]